MLLSFVSFFTIGFGVWVVGAVHGYREEYAQATQAWNVGSVRTVELTLLKRDKQALACASDEMVAGLHCGYRDDSERADSSSPTDPKVLQPLNTTDKKLFLGAGLWTSAALKESLPNGRFVVTCAYHVQGVVRSASVRFAAKRAMSPLKRTVTAGTLTDCVLAE